MNKDYARAWDQIEELAHYNRAELARDGHRIFYRWQSAEPADAPTVCLLWAEENVPRYGLRVGDISARFWNIEAVSHVLDLLLAPGAPSPLLAHEALTSMSR